MYGPAVVPFRPGCSLTIRQHTLPSLSYGLSRGQDATASTRIAIWYVNPLPHGSWPDPAGC